MSRWFCGLLWGLSLTFPQPYSGAAAILVDKIHTSSLKGLSHNYKRCPSRGS